MQNRFYYSSFFILIVCTAFAQNDGSKNIYDGNDYYHSGKVMESTEYYRNALKENPHNAKAHFNLGNSLYKTAFEIRKSKEPFIQAGKKITPDTMATLVFEEAANSFAQVANSVSDKDTLHRAWHNIGNCYLQKKEYENAVNAYKKSLKFNSKDEETRYNLAYALKNVKKDKKGGGGQNQQQKQDQKKQEQKNEMNKDQADQLLKALMREEKKLQDKRKQKQEDAGNTTVEKDW
jgi:Ca-activated chloride channel family protein